MMGVRCCCHLTLGALVKGGKKERLRTSGYIYFDAPGARISMGVYLTRQT